MSDDELEISRYMTRTTFRDTSSVEPEEPASKRTESPKILNKNVDKTCLYSLSKGLVRIEYPGYVKNVPKAIETLGGLYGIEMAVGEVRNKLELHLHPENIFSKPSVADRDLNPGLLIRVKKLKDKIDYEIVGYTSVNFKFNKMCEFQYLPLIPTNKSCEDDVEYVVDKIVPKKLPDLNYFLAKENNEQPIYSLPSAFTRYESQTSLYLKAGEKFNLDTNTRPELFKMWESRRTRNKIPTKSITRIVNFQDANVEIPEEPLPITMEIIEDKSWQAGYQVVKKLFEERPMWTKIAVLHKTGLSLDMAKIIIPAVAFFCPSGPWRMVWTKFGYNPLKNFDSRIYQTLDFRIRATEGMKIKVKAKRPYSSKKVLGALPSRKVVQSPSRDDLTRPDSSDAISERSYVLSSEYIPPARQMFYQYCDIKIPEIQDMFHRLPKLPIHQKFDSKNGWLPTNFTEQCREMANRCVIERVRRELMEDNVKMQRQQEEHNREEEAKESSPSSSSNTLTYCSKMLSNIKRGIYTSVNTLPPFGGEQVNVVEQEMPTVVNDLTEELIEDEEIDMDDAVDTMMPETMEENSDDENLSQCSDVEIDLETVEEINDLIAKSIRK